MTAPVCALKGRTAKRAIWWDASIAKPMTPGAAPGALTPTGLTSSTGSASASGNRRSPTPKASATTALLTAAPPVLPARVMFATSARTRRSKSSTGGAGVLRDLIAKTVMC